MCVLGWGTEPRCEPGPMGLHSPARPTAPSGTLLSVLVPRPTCSTKYTLAASRSQAFERWGHLAQLLLFILRLLPRLPRSGTSRWRDRWRVRRLRGRQAHPSPRGHWLALQAAGAARRHSPPTAVEASPGRGLVSGRQLATAAHATSCLSPSPPRVLCSALAMITDHGAKCLTP